MVELNAIDSIKKMEGPTRSVSKGGKVDGLKGTLASDSPNFRSHSWVKRVIPGCRVTYKSHPSGVG